MRQNAVSLNDAVDPLSKRLPRTEQGTPSKVALVGKSLPRELVTYFRGSRCLSLVSDIRCVEVTATLNRVKLIEYSGVVMKVLLPVLLAFFSQSYTNIEVTTLSFDAKGFQEAFNAAADQPRVVGVFSPTCGHCLQACSELEQILKEKPSARLTVFLLWAPFMRRDTLRLAQRATGYLPDHRVKHFWDLWKYAARTYQEQLKIPKGHAWDMFVFYKPHLLWQKSLPEPTFWLQNRNLKVGTPYSQDNLRAGLEEWIK